jgi:hypothetical protein
MILAAGLPGPNRAELGEWFWEDNPSGRPELRGHEPMCGHTRRLTGRVGPCCQRGLHLGDVRPHVARSGRIRRRRGSATTVNKGVAIRRRGVTMCDRPEWDRGS